MAVAVRRNAAVVAALGALGVAGSGAFGAVIWDTGAPHTVIFSGAESYLGFTSGYASGSQPQRWSALPFRVEGGPAAHITQIDMDWFFPAGSVADRVDYVIWRRTDLAAPVDGDQVLSGSLGAATAGIDDPRTVGVTDDWLHQYPVDFDLDAGDYYLTVYGASSTGASPATIAPLTGADLQAEDLEQDFMWRSSMFPSPGFEVYNPSTVQPGTGMTDAEDRWNISFTIYGDIIPTPGAASVLALGLAGLARRRRA